MVVVVAGVKLSNKVSNAAVKQRIKLPNLPLIAASPNNCKQACFTSIPFISLTVSFLSQQTAITR